MERLREKFNKETSGQLAREFGFTNVMSVPRLEKIVVNVGVGKIGRDQKMLDAVMRDLAAITGQRPVQVTAKKSIAGFKVREGQIVGVMVTLRKDRMYSFLDKLINVALPRVRDFRGVKRTGFDGRGNYHLGMREQIVFPEVASDALEHVFGMEVSIVTTAEKDEVARRLLELYNFPFVKE